MVSLLEQKRLCYQPPLPRVLQDLNRVMLRPHNSSFELPQTLAKLFAHTDASTCYESEEGRAKLCAKLTVGVFFSGGQAAGGHNVITGLYDGLKELHSECHLIGFLDGPNGLIENKTKPLDAAEIDKVRNLGGFDLIGSSRTKIETPEQFHKAKETVQKLGLDALIVIGGDDSNTNAALLAEAFLGAKIKTRVLGVPKTIDGDLRSPDIEISFGFDSACKTFSELIGNIARDALSAKKYYHFIKLMGRSASHIALECALTTRPNLTLIGEEQRSLKEIVTEIADLIEERKKRGKEYGIILIPEGLIEFLPEMRALIKALNQQGDLAEPHSSLFKSLPEKIQKQLLLERDPHGNVQVSQIETEQLVFALVNEELKKRGVKCNALNHFFGYEGRCCFPSNFDANYGYALGKFAALACREGLTGVILAIRHLRKEPKEWAPKAIPIVQLMHFEVRKGVEKPVIAKALVDLEGPFYQMYLKEKERWKYEDRYGMCGPMQFFGDPHLTDSVPLTLPG